MPDEGSLPAPPPTHAQNKFMSSTRTADKRSEEVSGERRGGLDGLGETARWLKSMGRGAGYGTRARILDSLLVTRHLSLYFPCPGFAAVSRIPYPESRTPFLPPVVTCHCLRVRLLVRASAPGRAAQVS